MIFNKLHFAVDHPQWMLKIRGRKAILILNDWRNTKIAIWRAWEQILPITLTGRVCSVIKTFSYLLWWLIFGCKVFYFWVIFYHFSILTYFGRISNFFNCFLTEKYLIFYDNILFSGTTNKHSNSKNDMNNFGGGGKRRERPCPMHDRQVAESAPPNSKIK